MFHRAVIGFSVMAILASTTSVTAQSGSDQTIRPIERALAVIARTEPQYRAWLSLDLPTALGQADAVTASTGDSPLHRLNGLVVAIKDNVDTDWLPTTAGSKDLRNSRPLRNASTIDRILAAGGVIPGKTNMDTFARGVRTFSELGGQTRNALDATKSPGGSSGGTAVAVALRQADVGIGTDTCGSLRYPAAYNGIYGLRTTPGLVSRSGLVPLSPTQDVLGPMARTPQNLALLLDVIAGPDGRDPATLRAPSNVESYVDVTRSPPASATAPLRIGVLRDRGPFRVGRDGRSSLDILRSAGFTLVEVVLPALGLPNVINEEFAVIKPQLLDRKLAEVSWIGGMSITTRAYRSKVVQMGTDEQRLFGFLDSYKLDALVYPTTPFLAARIGERQPSGNCSLSASTGAPALALPHPGAPIPGVDILGRPFSERVLLEIATGYELALSR